MFSKLTYNADNALAMFYILQPSLNPFNCIVFTEHFFKLKFSNNTSPFKSFKYKRAVYSVHV